MWVTTGASGWPFPQSLLAADWAARLGALVVALGLLLASLSCARSENPGTSRTLVARIVSHRWSAWLGLLATWSLQPAFRQGVGSQGPQRWQTSPCLRRFNSVGVDDAKACSDHLLASELSLRVKAPSHRR